MRLIFADSGYWIALLNPRDGLHQRARAVSEQLGKHRLITSDMMLVEVLNALAEHGMHIRQAAAGLIDAVTDDPGVGLVPQTRQLFRQAHALYRDRPDKGWSLTDCASFVIMAERKIGEALTYDQHFTQQGIVALLRADSVRHGTLRKS